jgi:hypothetical protein
MKDCGAEDDHEATAPGVTPVDLANAGDPGRHHPAEDIEAHRVADVELKALVHAQFHRNFRLGRRPFPERSLDDPFVRFEMVAVGDGVFPGE